MSIHIAIALAVVASIGFNVATAFQKSAAVRLPKLSFPPERRVLKAFLTNRPWIIAFSISGVSEGCFLISAANAPISLVQPLLGTGLVVLAGFSVFYLKEKLGAGEWIGIFTLIAGLALLGASAEVGEVRGLEAISWPRLLVLTAALLASVFVVRAIELRRPGTFSIELVVGAAGGVLIGIGALFTRVTMLEFGAGHIVFGVVLIVITMGMMLSGVFTQQGGFQRGRAMTVTAVLAVLNKIIAIFGGMFALGEVLPENPTKQRMRLIALAGLLLGTVLLARFSKPEVPSTATEPAGEAGKAQSE